MITVPILGFSPDLDPTTPGALQTCAGYESTLRGWKLQRDLDVVATIASGTVGATDGLVSHVQDGTEVVHFATSDGISINKLYRLNGASITDVSRAAAYSNSTRNWSFCQFGNYTLATNLYDVVQIRDASGSGAFADSTATGIPKAKIAVTWGPPTLPRVIFFHYNDGTEYPDGWWSGHEGGPTADWTVNRATESVNGRLLGAGPIRCGSAFRDNIVAFGDNEMWVGQFDDTFIVNWQRLAQDVGCVGMYAAKVVGGILYFLGQQGLYAYDGSYPRKMEVPVQDHLRAMLVNPLVNKRYSQLAIDSTGQRLLVVLRSGFAGPVTECLSINLLNHRVGQRSITNGEAFFDNKYAIDTLSTTRRLRKENDSPITNANNYYMDSQVVGDISQVSLLKTVWPRFITAPTSFAIDYVGSMALSDVRTFPGTPTTVAASPWRAQLTKSNRFHGVRWYINSNGTDDPELVSMDLDLVDAGRE